MCPNRNNNDLRVDISHPLMYVGHIETKEELDTPIDIDKTYVCMPSASQGIVLGYRIACKPISNDDSVLSLDIK